MLVRAAGLFVVREAEQTFTRLWQEVSGDPRSFGEHARESKRATMRSSLSSEINMHEHSLRGFVTGMFSLEAFETALETAASAIAPYGVSNGLAQVVLKIASPGVADTYQGSELWDLRLVDPDNRGPVDYVERRAALRAIEGARAADLLASYRDARVKLHVLRAGLRLRRAMPKTFIEGDYAALDAGEDVFAFSRNHASGSIVCAVTRRPHHATGGRAPFAVGDVWRDRRLPLPRGEWRDVLTGAELLVDGDVLASRLFAELPVALLAPL